MLRVAIIGLGTIAPIHKAAIEDSEFATLVAVCDTDETKKEGYENVAFYSSIEDMINNEELDVVHNCLPHYLHHVVTEQCAKKGIHVFTEKPVAITYKDAETIMDLEDKYNVKVGVCLQNRYNTTANIAKKVVESKEYGELIGSKALVTWSRTMDYYNQAKWRGIMETAGGGVLINQTIHSLDLLDYIGGKITKIHSLVGNLTLPETEIEDTVVSHVRYENGARGIFFATIAYFDNSAPEFEFIMEKAKLIIRDSKVYLKENSGDLKQIGEDNKLIGSKHYYGPSHMVAIETFYKAVINNTDDYITVREAAYPIKMIEATMASAKDKVEKEI